MTNGQRERRIQQRRAWRVFWALVWVLLGVIVAMGHSGAHEIPSVETQTTGSNSGITAARPYWAEFSMMVDGADLVVIGVASRAASIEEGRRVALAVGVREIAAYGGVGELIAARLPIETQRTHEEFYPDGTVTVFRLMRVSIQKLLEAGKDSGSNSGKRERMTSEGGGNRIRSGEGAVTPPPPDPATAARWARVRIRTALVCGRVIRGMVESDVLSLAGEPDGRNEEGTVWFYGTARIYFTGPSVVGALGCG